MKKKEEEDALIVRVHMGPGNYGLFPVHVLPIFWPRYSLFIREKWGLPKTRHISDGTS